MKTIALIIGCIALLEVFGGCAANQDNRVGSRASRTEGPAPVATGPNETAFRPNNPLDTGLSY